ncbi:putative DNA repair protein RadC [Filifactor alocis ATCC 35896]|uniref:DNA repair protein RadC n=1 Tax=Filifactor alocis (strain ATCC 35896 / CCUG 47790 / D40 B5) TaxID=546269 RepID=D6GRN9_FILAD|nr:JAB domain-containing protein [Filifactor alocis]EFE28330.1 putative DNA repair protein RadC [Filifactor alocis ATCC 35896]
MINEARYIQSYAKIIGVKEEAAISYAQKKGTLALINNASGLLTTKTQREKHKAFVDLYRMSSELHHENPVLSSPEAVTSFMQSVMEHIHDKEAMMAVFLDTKNRVIDYEEVSLGTINSSIVHPREIFRGAVINKANAIILCHNHPSGDLTPSGEDKTITLRLKEAGKLMGLRFWIM